MTNTVKLYYEDCYIKKFTAKVTSCVCEKHLYAVTLDQTAFYPEGGGQPYDTGSINGNVSVLSVYERNGVILHYTNAPLEINAAVKCEIDWERRFSLMQQHTGEHIVSGIINALHGLSNVGFHMGSEFMTIDINGELNEENLQEIEMTANKAVYENIEVTAAFKTHSELLDMTYRSKKELDGDVRIVTVLGYDFCACCGLHCKTTGEIGIIKIINFQKYKSGTRIYMLCGIKALKDYISKNKSTYDISVLLSSKQAEVTNAVKQLVEDISDVKRRTVLLKQRLFSCLAEKVPDGTKNICLFEDNLTPADLGRLCILLCEKSEVAVVLSADNNSYKYAAGSKNIDIRQLVCRMNEALFGKGGGKKELSQGSLTAEKSEIIDFLKSNGFILFPN